MRMQLRPLLAVDALAPRHRALVLPVNADDAVDLAAEDQHDGREIEKENGRRDAAQPCIGGGEGGKMRQILSKQG